ncbi:MAG TPA: hypothetical protein ENN21_06780 [Spirochaetes bacterium]|nr:hypothetical protein [Spirochaetota bacterium]
MTPRVWTAITDLILAGEAFFVAGMLTATTTDFYSAGGMWALAMLFLGLSTLAGGIDHGFFELPEGDLKGRTVTQKGTWLLTGGMTLCILLSASLQFIPGEYHTLVLAVGCVQLLVFSVLALKTDRFLVVILNYLPVILLFLILNILGIASGKGNWYLVAGVLVTFIASAVQTARVNILHPLDWNSLYHLIMMPALVLFYYGGKELF